MKIRSKLAWTYIILLVIGIITISAYSILTIRSYLLHEGAVQFEKDVRSLALSISSYTNDSDFASIIEQQSQLLGYEIAVYDVNGLRVYGFPDSVFRNVRPYLDAQFMEQLAALGGEPFIDNNPGQEKLIAFAEIADTDNIAFYLRISQDKSQLYAAVTSIRHIIYGGMFFSIGAVIIVSILFARYIARPISQLNDAAIEIAQGNIDMKININRNDEFGTLADSLNHMAGTLRKDNEQLKNLNEKQSQFFADITHEVRNPLHTISGALEMLELENLPDDKKKKYIHTAHRQINRVARLFEDIKTLQRYDFDKSFINKQKINIQQVVAEVAELYQPIAQEKNLELKVKKARKIQVNADPDKMEQVMDNLISNAIKYTPQGSIEVGCVQKGDVVEVYVKDTGPGISAEHLERLFDRFYRTDKARSRDKGGTGLGLSVVKGILNAHQSEIKVESIVGQGSYFYFRLPVIQS